MVKKILVIEDELQTRNLLLECLEIEGFYTISAINGLDGINQIYEQLPDLVICDIAMQGLDGYRVLDKIRQDPIAATIPFIFLTAKAAKADLRHGMELGADDYLTKPCTAEELLGAIAAQLKKQETLKQWVSAYSQQATELPPAEKSKPAVPKSIFPDVPALEKIFHFIEANYRQPITLCNVAQAVGYSPAYLTNLVRCQTGQTVNAWIVKRRMVEARSLLLETNQAVEHIATTVGYRSAGHFFRQFRQLYGTTPQVWRNANRHSV